MHGSALNCINLQVSDSITVNYLSKFQINLQVNIQKEKFKLNVGASLYEEPLMFELVRLLLHNTSASLV